MIKTGILPRPGGRFRNSRGLVTHSTIRRLAQDIVDRFRPRKIILFGSYARGVPRPDSDVDLLVEMATRNEIDQALRIEESLEAPFSLDVIVRTPRNLAWRVAEGDWFLTEVLQQGQVLYESTNEGVGSQSRGRRRGRQGNSRRRSRVTG